MLPHSDVPPPSIVTVTEAAALARVTSTTIYNMIKRGELRRFKIGRATRLRRDEVLALIGGDALGETASDNAGAA